ncbi:MAG: prolyl-tRNA synthetase associated domain-containing protein [Clostridia bacterium]|nr:prolyl-tRNA synthetase associated domain-containing protein [Clostridia bacterium]
MNRSDPNEIYRLLEQLKIPYRKVEHLEASSMADLTAVEGELNAPFCKNLFLCNRQKTDYYLLLIRENKRFRTAEVSKLIGASRLSFGEADRLYELLGVHPGAITPLGLVFDGEKQVRLLVDKDLLSCREICVHPCVNTASVALKTADLFEKYFPFTGHKPQLLEITGEVD